MNIFILRSSSTPGGSRRIGEIVSKGANPKIKWDMGTSWPSNLSKYDGIILHNRLDVRPGAKCAVYPCGMPQARLLENSAERNNLIKRKPRVVWTNTHTAAELLGKAMPKVDVKCMLKPFPILVPKECPKPPKTGSEAAKTILWYWRRNWPYTKNITKLLVQQMNELDNFNIWIIGNKRKPVLPDEFALKKKGLKLGNHVVAKGRLDIPAHRDDFIGMVRATEGMDFGRVTYQVQALGKWTLYVAKPMKEWKEPYVKSVKYFSQIKSAVESLAETWKDNHCKEVYDFVKSNFTERALRKQWEEELFRVFG